MTDAELDGLLEGLGRPDLEAARAALLGARAGAVFSARAAEMRSPWRRGWRRTWDAAEPWLASAAVLVMLQWAVATVRPVLGG